MVRTATPTLGDVRHGSGAADKFDYYKNPIRLSTPGGNPVMLIRHGGGGVSGSHQDERDSTFGEMFYLKAFLRGAWNTTYAQNPTVPWDIISFSSGQRSHLKTSFQQTSPVPAAHRSMFFPDAIRDCQRAIAAIKRMAGRTISGVSLDYDPTRMIGYGDSYGATLIALSQLAPPLTSAGGDKAWFGGPYAPGTASSRLRGCVLSQPQIKCDPTFMWGDQYFGWFGGRGDSSSAQDASVAGRALRWTEGGGTGAGHIDISGGYAQNAFGGTSVGDIVNLRGVNCAAGTYAVHTVTSTTSLALTTSPGASAFFINNCNWNNGARAISTVTAGAFSTMEVGDKIWISAGTGVTVGEYTVTSILSGTTIVVDNDINGAGGAINDSSVAFYSGYAVVNQQARRIGPQVQAMASIKTYFDNSDADFYPGFYLNYAVQGSHTVPHANAHDSAQYATLQSSITGAGLPFAGQLLNAGDLDSSAVWPDATGSPNGAITSAVLARYQQFDAWMASQIS